MNDLISLATAIFSVVEFPLGELLAKSTMILALVALTCTLLGHRTAALRHRVWLSGLAAALVLPLAAVLLPHHTWRVLPGRADPPTVTSGSDSSLQPPAVAVAPTAPAPLTTIPHSPTIFTSDREVDGNQHSVDQSIADQTTDNQTVESRVTGQPLEEQPQIAAVIPTPLPLEPTTPLAKPSWNFVRVCAACWMVGTLLGWILFLYVAIQREQKLIQLPQLVDSDWTASVTAAARTLGLNQPIVTLECDVECVPSVVGIVRPRLLIPQNWRLWSLAQRRCILLHELAHVKRRDVLAQFLGRLALIVYWFHPLAWLAVRQMRVERELAADDCVLLSGQIPSDYADQLLTTLRLYRPVTPEMGVAMAHSCRLDQRVLAILDPGRQRGPVSRPLSLLSVCVVGLLAGLLGTTSIAPRLAIATMPVDSPADSSSDQAVEPIADPPKKPLSVISAMNVADLRQIAEVKTNRRIYRMIRGPKNGQMAWLNGDYRAELVDDSTFGTIGELAQGNAPTDFALSRDGKKIAWTERDESTYHIDNVGGGAGVEIDVGDQPGDAAFSPDGKLIAIGKTYWDPKVEGAGSSEMRLYDLVGKLVRVFAGSQPGGLIPVFSPNGRILAVGNRNAGTDLFDVATGKRLHTLDKKMTHEIAFSPDGQTLAASYVDGRVVLWDVATGKKRESAASGCKEMYSLDWSPAGDLLVTAGQDGPLVLWDTKTLTRLRELEGPVWVNQVRFTSDGTRVLWSSASDATARKDLQVAVWAIADPSQTDILRIDHQTVSEPPTAQTKPVAFDSVERLGMKFIPLSAGRYYSGWDGSDDSLRPTEISQHFEIATHTVTQGEWTAVMGNNPSHFSRGGRGKESVQTILDMDLEQFPVENVSFEETQKFIQRVNEKERDSGYLYRLPTSAEWEYACRDGATTRDECSFRYYTDQPSNRMTSFQANFQGNLSDESGPYLARPAKVGSYAPNQIGLYDMHGNIAQWCDDVYQKEPRLYVVRGGSWKDLAGVCEANSLSAFAPDTASWAMGFRLVRVPIAKPQGMGLGVFEATMSERKWNELASYPNLTSLRIEHTQLSDPEIQELFRLKNLTNLTIQSTKVTDAGFKELAKFKQLTVLSVRISKITDAGVKELTALTNLTELHLDITEVTDEGLAELAAFPKLTTLDISHTKVTDAGLKHLAGIKGLTTLIADANRITDAGLKDLAAIRNLRQLHLNHTLVTDEGLKDLARLRGLTTLSLGATKVTNLGILELEPLENLTFLSVRDTKVNNVGVRDLQRLLPNSQIFLPKPTPIVFGEE